jgi:hypothetical protein
MRQSTPKKTRSEGRLASVHLSGLEWWRTEHLLVAYERLFGSLEPRSKSRIIRTARTRGWDRTWDESAAA